MVLKTIDNIEEMKNNEERYRELEQAERTFASQYNLFTERKKRQLEENQELITQAFNSIKDEEEKL